MYIHKFKEWAVTIATEVPIGKCLKLNSVYSCYIQINTYSKYHRYGWSWIYNYLCNQCLSPLMLWVQISIRARCTTLCDKVCQWLATGRWFSLGPPFSSTNKTDRHDKTEILLKVALNTIKQMNQISWLTLYISKLIQNLGIN